MDEARSLSAAQAFGAVMAESQTAGRGRLSGRSWDTPPGQALLATIWFPRSTVQQAESEPPVSLMAGLAVTKACLALAGLKSSPFKRGLAVKWPNDLLCENRKLAGILCEASEGTMYVGIGINCSQDSFTGTYRTEPTSFMMETGLVPDRYQLLTMILDELGTLIAMRTGWLEELDHLLAWKGKTVQFKTGLADGQPVTGVLAGMAVNGGLLLKTGTSITCFHSGELSPVIDEYR